jgi:hypothetical protein
VPAREAAAGTVSASATGTATEAVTQSVLRKAAVGTGTASGHLLQDVGCLRGGGGHFLLENGRLRLDPNRGEVFHNLAKKSRISTGPPATRAKNDFYICPTMW